MFYVLQLLNISSHSLFLLLFHTNLVVVTISVCVFLCSSQTSIWSTYHDHYHAEPFGLKISNDMGRMTLGKLRILFCNKIKLLNFYRRSNEYFRSRSRHKTIWSSQKLVVSQNLSQKNFNHWKNPSGKNRLEYHRC